MASSFANGSSTGGIVRGGGPGSTMTGLGVAAFLLADNGFFLRVFFFAVFLVGGGDFFLRVFFLTAFFTDFWETVFFAFFLAVIFLGIRRLLSHLYPDGFHQGNMHRHLLTAA